MKDKAGRKVVGQLVKGEDGLWHERKQRATSVTRPIKREPFDLEHLPSPVTEEEKDHVHRSAEV